MIQFLLWEKRKKEKNKNIFLQKLVFRFLKRLREIILFFPESILYSVFFVFFIRTPKGFPNVLNLSDLKFLLSVLFLKVYSVLKC